jgi:hypothetical protein
MSEHGHFTYTFEELQPYPDMMVLAYGEATIVWEWQDGDPDVGYRGGPSYYVDDISLDHSKDPGVTPLDGKTELYALIEKALMSRAYESHIVSEIEDRR